MGNDAEEEGRRGRRIGTDLQREGGRLADRGARRGEAEMARGGLVEDDFGAPAGGVAHGRKGAPGQRLEPGHREEIGVDLDEAGGAALARSEERSVGKACVSTCRSRW